MKARDVKELQLVLVQNGLHEEGQLLVRFPTLDEHGTTGLAFLPKDFFDRDSLSMIWHQFIAVVRPNTEVELQQNGETVPPPRWSTTTPPRGAS